LVCEPSGLTNGRLEEADRDALLALEGSLGQAEFWSPEVLDNLPDHAVEAFVREASAEAPGSSEFLAVAQDLIRVKPWERLVATVALLDRAIKWMEKDPRPAFGWILTSSDRGRIRALWALSYAVRLSLPLVLSGVNDADEGLSVEAGELLIAHWPHLWLPDDLKAPKEISLYGSQMAGGRLPKRLDSPTLILEQTNIMYIPEDIEVWVALDVIDCPLRGFTDAKLRRDAPGITGKILR
jgi:hypothetical protein